MSRGLEIIYKKQQTTEKSDDPWKAILQTVAMLAMLLRYLDKFLSYYLFFDSEKEWQFSQGMVQCLYTSIPKVRGKQCMVEDVIRNWYANTASLPLLPISR